MKAPANSNAGTVLFEVKTFLKSHKNLSEILDYFFANIELFVVGEGFCLWPWQEQASCLYQHLVLGEFPVISPNVSYCCVQMNSMLPP